MLLSPLRVFLPITDQQTVRNTENGKRRKMTDIRFDLREAKRLVMGVLFVARSMFGSAALVPCCAAHMRRAAKCGRRAGRHLHSKSNNATHAGPMPAMATSMTAEAAVSASSCIAPRPSDKFVSR